MPLKDAVDAMSDAEKLQLLETLTRAIADHCSPIFNAAHGAFVFAVLGFTVGEDGTMTWVSNGNQEDMVVGLRSMADKLEQVVADRALGQDAASTGRVH